MRNIPRQNDQFWNLLKKNEWIKVLTFWQRKSWMTLCKSMYYEWIGKEENHKTNKFQFRLASIYNELNISIICLFTRFNLVIVLLLIISILLSETQYRRVGHKRSHLVNTRRTLLSHWNEITPFTSAPIILGDI